MWFLNISIILTAVTSLIARFVQQYKISSSKEVVVAQLFISISIFWQILGLYDTIHPQLPSVHWCFYKKISWFYISLKQTGGSITEQANSYELSLILNYLRLPRLFHPSLRSTSQSTSLWSPHSPDHKRLCTLWGSRCLPSIPRRILSEMSRLSCKKATKSKVKSIALNNKNIVLKKWGLSNKKFKR